MKSLRESLRGMKMLVEAIDSWMSIIACNWNKEGELVCLREGEESQLPERLRNLSITYSHGERVEKWPEKLKSHNDDQTEHSSCGGYQRGMSMHRDCMHCMHKVHKSYKYIVQRGDAVVFVAGVVVDVVVEGDSCMTKDQSAAAEKNRRRIVQQMDMVDRA
jgi:hypothetical protein